MRTRRINLDDGDIVGLKKRSEVLSYDDGVAAIRRFDMEERNENTSDTLIIRNGNQTITLDTPRSILAFARSLESDGRAVTDAVLSDEGDLTFVLNREEGRVTDGIVLDGIVGPGGLSTNKLFRLGVDSPGQTPGESDEVLGYNPPSENTARTIFNNKSSEANVFQPGQLVINRFDVQNQPNEPTSDTLRFELGGETVLINTRNELLNFITRINSDADPETDALFNDERDLTLVLSRTADGAVENGIVLADILRRGLTLDQVRAAGAIEANTTPGENDTIGTFNTSDDALLF